ncbi:Spy/CpxP family protein refolding chaperone [Variovorax terrae]|uniref:Spy/CpxP family protein refolding chaperone n=1 Tax=Variovorax terrae TaxID=2923278 RepID=A0A9X1W098_9BURK|nr:Spy/CpxP family protein refolding chaperone [Variovorax terrae]MCJ0765434.1 Spy/CpxP family protein refolding chaperone [Variovorax terrae]
MTPAPTPDVLRLPDRRRMAGLAALSGLVMLSLQSRAQDTQGRAPRSDRPGDAAARIDALVARMLQRVDGSPAQKERITGIAHAALADIGPLREQHRAARLQGLALLAAPTLDRAALEQLRQSQLRLLDALSRRATQALADAAEVLQPQQRRLLATRLKERLSRPGPG